MSRVASRRARMAAAALLLCLPQLLRPAPAQGQAVRRALTRMVSAFTGQLETAVTEGGAPAVRTGCKDLYDQDVMTVGQGAEPMGSRAAWLIASYDVLKNTRGPLPICFEWQSDRVDTNLARTLLRINNLFIENDSMPLPRSTGGLSSRDWDGYELAGHADSAENVSALSVSGLARRRAETIQNLSTGVKCRFVPSTRPNETAQVYYRKVTYTYRPVVDRCPR